MKRTVKQNNQLHAICSKLKIDKEMKEGLVRQFTQGRESSSAEMTIPECQSMINHLNHLSRNSVEVVPAAAPQKYKSSEDRMRAKVIAMCHQLGWKKPNGKIDMDRVNGYCLKHTNIKKPLNEYPKRHLYKLITQIDYMLQEYSKRDA